METQQTTTAPAAAVMEKSLLDTIIDRQAEIASRYMPVMDTAQVVKRMKAIQELKELVLVEGIDYGVIPGTDKPTLFKPGAEKICAFFGYVPDIHVVAEIEDWKGERFGEPIFYYRYRVSLLKDGFPVGQGEGSANSWESKYRWRNANRKCPACGKETIIKGKEEYGGGWLCFAKKGGCNAKFAAGDKSIEGQEVGRVANPDFADIINTIQKMGQKRAYIAATLSATGASQWFTQDLEDMPPLEGIQRDAAKVDTGGAPVGTKQAAANVAERKLAEAKAKATANSTVPKSDAPAGPDGKLPMNFTAIMNLFGEQKIRIGDIAYYAILREVGGEKCDHANKLGDMKNFQRAYDLMLAAPAAAGEAVAV